MKTYTLILRGIDAVAFHPRVAKSAQMLIRKLCRAVPAERIGYLKNGMGDIKNHKYVLLSTTTKRVACETYTLSISRHTYLLKELDTINQFILFMSSKKFLLTL